MDYLGALDGLMDWMPLTLSEHVESMLPFPSTSNVLVVDAPTAEALPCFHAVLLTSAFCIALTAILLLICRLCPISEFVLILDMNSISAHLDALQQHRNSLQRVKVKAFGEYDEAELVPLFRELGQLPKLQDFSVDLRLPFSLISTVLDGAKNLDQLSLQFQLREDDSDGDITALAESIQSHQCLRSIAVESSFYDPGLDRNLDPVIRSVGALQTLKVLSLYNMKCSASALASVFQCKNLRELEICNVTPLTLELIEMLQENKSIESLIAPMHRGTEALWGNLVQHNDSLRKLMLVIEDYDNQQSSNNPPKDMFLPVIQALGNNRSLRSLTLDVSDHLAELSRGDTLGPSAHCMRFLASSIANNQTLTALRISHCSEDICDDENLMKSLIEAVKENYSLVSFWMRTGSCCSKSLDVPEIQFYLKSNLAGRGQIFQTAPGFWQNEAISRYIVQNRMDVSMIYHLLQEKPEVVQNIDPRNL